MKWNELLQLTLFFLVLVLSAPAIGRYMYNVFTNRNHFMKPILGPLENAVYRILRINRSEDMDWKTFTFSVLIFNFIGLVFLFLIQIYQSFLPLNPNHVPDVSLHLAFNTAISFVTNTNWQSYAGETTLSYFVQMVGLTVQNFLSAATGIAVVLALIRGIVSKSSISVGSFWVDLTRCIIYVLLPFSVFIATVLISQGVVQTISKQVTAQTMEGGEQTIITGPVASQVAIKQLGTNGGGFYNTNSAHPFENPTPFSNFLELIAIILIPAGLVFTYGFYINSKRQAQVIFMTMILLLFFALGISLWSEYQFNSVLHLSANMEGKETRFGVMNSVLWSVITTATSNGSINAMHDSMSPLSGMVSLLNMMTGEVIFGGAGSGLYGMIIFILITIFITGLMVGRTPEYLGKKVEAFEIKMAIIAVLAPNFVIKIFSGIACISDAGLAGLNNAGPHGLSEILYAFSSAASNNGSAFAGLNANTLFYNLMLGTGMLIGRFGIIIPVMAIAGSMAGKKITPVSSGTFKTDNWLFVFMLMCVILIIGGLTFFPSLAFGPLSEYFLLQHAISF